MDPCEAGLLHVPFGSYFRGSPACLLKQKVDLLLHFFNGSGDFLVRRRPYRLHLLPHHLDMEQMHRQCVNRVGGQMVIPFVGYCQNSVTRLELPPMRSAPAVATVISLSALGMLAACATNSLWRTHPIAR
jgi:hypothetical protein